MEAISASTGRLTGRPNFRAWAERRRSWSRVRGRAQGIDLDLVRAAFLRQKFGAVDAPAALDLGEFELFALSTGRYNFAVYFPVFKREAGLVEDGAWRGRRPWVSRG